MEPPLTRVLEILYHHGLLRRVPGEDISSLMKGGVALWMHGKSLIRWAKRGEVDYRVAFQEIHDEIGRKDAEVLAEIEKVFNPTSVLKNLLKIHVKDKSFLSKLKEDSESVSLVHALSKALEEKA